VAIYPLRFSALLPFNLFGGNTERGGETPPVLAGEDAYATHGRAGQGVSYQAALESLP
jgi:hypothetical protein